MTAEEIRNELKGRWSDFSPESNVEIQAEIAAQLAEINALLRDTASEGYLSEECRKHKCSYYSHYLAYGPADLTHEGFHSAEKHCEDAQKRMQEWMDNPANEGKHIPQLMGEMCGRWEKAVRA
jgi:hypothetical protein